MNRPIVVAVTGASGAAYAQRLLEVLLHLGRDVALTISPSGAAVWRQELGVTLNLNAFDPATLQLVASPGPAEASSNVFLPVAPEGPRPLPRGGAAVRGQLTYHHHEDFFAPIASGSYLTGGMVICPCSGTTLSGVVYASGANLPQRAASVHLKERRRLILVPRETPLSVLQLDNMRRAAEAGAVMLPAAPGWYHGVRSTLDLVDFIVARILDQLDIEHGLMKRWGSESTEQTPPPVMNVGSATHGGSATSAGSAKS